MNQNNHQSRAMEVRQALWALQKEVLNSLKDEFDREVGYQAAPTEWFQVLMNAERYQWLRDLTSLMADIDIMTELDFLTDQHLSVARQEIEALLLAHELEKVQMSAFATEYSRLLLSGLSLLPLHSRLKASLQILPKPTLAREQSTAERKAWHEEHRHQARKKRN
jgi:hypothetical protein